MAVGGSLMAIPHGKRSVFPVAAQQFGVTEYQNTFREVPHCYASMDRKPLQPYHPNAPRSRLAVEDAGVPLKNASSVVFHDRFCVHKRRFVTTQKNHYTGESPDYRNNPGMIADSTRLKRFLSEK